MTAESDSSWWTRRGGGSEVLRVAVPLVVSSLSWTVMTFVDRVFLKWVSGTAMAAAFSASMLWFSVLCLPLGICAYVNTFVSQYYGDRQPWRIGCSMWQGVWIALLFSPLALCVIPLAPLIFALARHTPEACALETQYFQILCLGAPAMLIGQAFASFYSGRGNTRVVMWVDGFFAIVNLVLDYVWIFGYAGFPALGIAGAGWATVTALWLKVVCYVAMVLQADHRQQYGTLSGMRFDRDLFGRLIYFGGPSGVQMLLDVIGFTVFVMLIGRLGDVQYEATSMAFSISTLGFMPIWGLGIAASILVGQRLGENRDDLAARSTWTTLCVAWAYMGLISTLYVMAPGLFLYWFFAGAEGDGALQAEVWNLSTKLLCFVAAYNLLDAMLMVFVSALKGAGDTRFVLHVSLVMAVLLAGMSWLCVEVLQLSVYGCWALITLWVWTMGLVFMFRFLRGSWRKMRVIEMRGAEGMRTPEDAVALEQIS